MPKPGQAGLSDLASPLVYRTVLPTRQTDIFPIVRKLSAEWLGEKYSQAPLVSGLHPLSDGTTLMVQSAYRVDGTERALRIQLREDKPEATWRTTITAGSSEDSHAGHVAVALECFPQPGRSINPGRPRIVVDLVTELRPFDGPSKMTAKPQRVPTPIVDQLLDVLCDPDRRYPVIVAACPLRQDVTWSDRARKLMRHSVGSASLYILPDAEAADRFRELVGDSHRVAPGAVRTFLPEVDPAWHPDAARHRFITPTRMCDNQDRAWSWVPRATYRLALEAPLPPALRAVKWEDSAQRQLEHRQAAREEARAMTQPSSRNDTLTVEARTLELEEEVRTLTGLLEEADNELQQATSTSKLAEETASSLEEQASLAASQWKAEMEDHLHTMAEMERAHAENIELRRQVARLQAHQPHPHTSTSPSVGADLLVSGPPSTFEELWARLDAFPHLCITAERTLALDLDEHEQARVWAGKAWHALKALDSYGRLAGEGEVKGGFFQHCSHPSPGAVIYPIKQLAMGETMKTREMWGEERWFPAPAALAPSKRMEMTAHLKLSSKGSISPRIYFLDDVKGITSTVVVGYIGPHLTNSKT